MLPTVFKSKLPPPYPNLNNIPNSTEALFLPQHPSTPPRILVFNSGIGGLSIWQKIHERLPNAELLYCSENAFFPYGTKADELLIQRLGNILLHLEQHYHPNMMVVACNTASTVALPHIRAKLSCPVVGVVPAIKPAAAHSQSKVIGLIATPATVQRAYTQQLIQDFAKECTVISVGSSELVLAAEAKLRGETPNAALIQHIIDELMAHPDASQLDTIVLGCTHFPFLQDELAAHCCNPIPFFNPVTFIDSGEAIAKRVMSLVEVSSAIQPTTHRAIFTQEKDDIHQLIPTLKRFGLHTIDFIPTATKF